MLLRFSLICSFVKKTEPLNNFEISTAVVDLPVPSWASRPTMTLISIPPWAEVSLEFLPIVQE
jgi:hypothetical protein